MTAFTTEEIQALTTVPDGDSLPDFPLTVFSDICVVEQVIEEKSAGGIIFVATGEERKLPCGKVVAVGPGRIYTTELNASGSVAIAHFVPTRVKVGDFVVFGKYQSAGEPLEYQGKRYLMCRETDLAGVSKTGDAVSLRLAKAD